jgi:WD40 repeat protein
VSSFISPYRGLQYFDCKHEDAEYFFGRQALIDQLLEKVRTSNFLAVLGVSGSGKSSLVRTGLLYQLQCGQRLPGSNKWRFIIFRPGEHPFQHLTQALVELGLSEVDSSIELAKIRAIFGTGATEGLVQVITSAEVERVVLVIDQFEEAFSLCRNTIERQRFFQCILGALQRTDNKLCLVLTMRADFFGKCAEQEYSGLAQQIQQNLVTVTPMTKEELTQVITEPANKGGLQVQEELVEQIIADVEGSTGNLPLLQYTLTQLWQQGEFTLPAYTRLGSVKETLEKRATEVYQSFSTDEQLVSKEIFLQLTQLGEGTEDTSRQVLLQDLISSPQQKNLVESVIGKLAAENVGLLTTTELGKLVVVDLAHETLIQNWSLLHHWITENTEVFRQRQQIELAAKKWLDSRKEKARLLQKEKLAQVKDFLQRYGERISLSSLAQDLIEVSQAEQRRLEQETEQQPYPEIQQQRKAPIASKTITKFALGTTLVLGIVGIFAFIQSRIFNPLDAWKTQRSQDLNLISTENTSNLDLNALINNLKAGKQLQTVPQSTKVDTNTKLKVLTNLQQVFYGIKEQNRLIKHEALINGVAFSRDGKILASASRDKTVKLWRTDGTLITTLPHEDGVNGVVFSPDGKTIASASSDKTVKLWRTNGTLITTLQHEAPVNGVAFKPDSKAIASAGSDKTVKLWRIDGTLINTIKGHQASVNGIVFSPDGKTIASASSDKTVKLWRIDGTLINTIKGHEDVVNGVAFSPDGKTIASASSDKTVKLWRTDGTLITSLQHDGLVNAIAFSPDGKKLASVSGDKTVKLWRIDGSLITTLKAHEDGVNGVAFSSDSKTLASGSSDKTIKLWQIDGTTMTTFKGHEASVHAAGLSPDGKIVASASWDNTVKLWRTDGTLITTLQHEDGVNSIAFSPDSKIIASASWGRTVKLWRTNGTLITNLKGHEDAVNGVAFSPDGKILASASRDKTVKLWRSDGTLVTTIQGHEDAVNAVTFSPNGKILASASADETVKLWQTNGSLITTLQGHDDGVNGIAFSPDGNIIASASRDKTVKLWRIDGSLITTLKGHEDAVNGVAFSPDSNIIATASADKTVKLWRTSDASLIITLKRHEFEVNSVIFSADGKILVSASSDKTAKLWNFNLDNLVNSSCEWLHDYLQNPNNGMKLDEPNRHICDDVQPK